MEKRWQLDFAGYSGRGRAIGSLIRATVFFSVSFLSFSLFNCPSICLAQVSPDESLPEFTAHVRQLLDQARWAEVVEAFEARPASTPELDYVYGSALAQLGRLDDAKKALLSGHRLAQADPRFDVELGGIAFKKKRYAESAAWLRRGLRINPADGYTNDFLGTVYFLQGNLEAALKYWNRADKPQIETVAPDHPLKIRPELLDHALAFSPAGPLLLPELLTSRARIDGLGIFPRPAIQLAAREDGNIDVILNLRERNGWGDGIWESLLSTFRGIAYETLYPEYFNLHHSAINFTSLVRFDPQKRRGAAEISSPLRGSARRRYRVGVDLRNENWAIRDSFTGPAPILAGMNLRREAGSAEILSLESGRWDWSAGLELSHRDYRSVDARNVLTPSLLLQGAQLKQFSHLRYELWRDPDRRLNISSFASGEFARIWSHPAKLFAKLQGGASARWFPKSEGDDYLTQVQARGGETAGDGPFDEFFMLGLERDNDLFMRGHIGTRDGRKGSAPLGSRFFLTNAEFDKNVYGNGLLSFKLSPFLDTGNIRGSNQLGSRRWLWDTGLQAKVRVLGVGLNFIWGKDLLTGKNAFYFSAVR